MLTETIQTNERSLSWSYLNRNKVSVACCLGEVTLIEIWEGRILIHSLATDEKLYAIH